jgi:GNAT superfamily N-acetyltransferase
MKVVAVVSPQQRSAIVQAPGLAPFSAKQIAGHAADIHLCAVGPAGEICAYCSLWWKETPPLEAHRVGAIGHYASVDDDAAAALLAEAARLLRENGCTMAVGPMDGNTWRRYRFVTDPGPIEAAEPPFFLEPANPPGWPCQFERAGFARLAEYYSALNSDLDRHDERIAPIAERLENLGVVVRSSRNTDLHDQLRRIYAVSRISFARNFLYTELSESAFIEQYLPQLDRIQPELLLLAESGDDLAGYLFAIPDLAQAARGQAIDTFIIKTVAILPEPQLRGLGGLLVARAHEAGRRLGYTRAIHALMHKDNVSRNISGHYASTMRTYALYGRELER